jgi:hypothetical protein
MKHYAVEIKRTSFITIHVEAKNPDEAEALAWKELENGADPVEDADWECSDIYEQFATDETRSNG